MSRIVLRQANEIERIKNGIVSIDKVLSPNCCSNIDAREKRKIRTYSIVNKSTIKVRQDIVKMKFEGVIDD